MVNRGPTVAIANNFVDRFNLNRHLAYLRHEVKTVRWPEAAARELKLYQTAGWVGWQLLKADCKAGFHLFSGLTVVATRTSSSVTTGNDRGALGRGSPGERRLGGPIAIRLTPVQRWRPRR